MGLMKDDFKTLIDRDASWIKFNERVLKQAEDPYHPILERLKFLAITANNLEEFLQVRLPSRINEGISENDLQFLLAKVESHIRNRQDTYIKLTKTLQENGIYILGLEDLDKFFDIKNFVQEFMQPVKETLQIIKCNEYDNAPLNNKGADEVNINDINNIGSIGDIGNISDNKISIKPACYEILGNRTIIYFRFSDISFFIPVPEDSERFVKIPFYLAKEGMEVKTKGVISFTKLENLIEYWFFHLNGLEQLKKSGKLSDFAGLNSITHKAITPVSSGVLRIIRDSELQAWQTADGNHSEDNHRGSANSNSNNNIEAITKAVKNRRKQNIIAITLNRRICDKGKQEILYHFGRSKPKIFNQLDIIAPQDLLQITEPSKYALTQENLVFPAFKSRFPERIDDFGGDIFASIRAKDIIVHHPYETYRVVTNFIRQAAYDNNVKAIYQTIYRTEANSSVIKALIEAIENGKQVNLIIEARARFDELANIEFGTRLKEAGAKVIFGIDGYKIHTKILLIEREEQGKTIFYSHIGTGNYHSITSKIYTDLSYFTCDNTIGSDILEIFNKIALGKIPRDLAKISVAPHNLRADVIALIKKEIAFAKKGLPAAIWLKMNAITDQDLIENLYAASQAGVAIDLIIRGICRLRPGVRGLSDNIRVKSVVGRFLEHSRIFCFASGFPMPSKHSSVFLSSADMMQRNMDSRIEIMARIDNETVKEQILTQILAANMRDEKQSYAIQPDGNFVKTTFNASSFSAHQYFVQNPSLSGRGSALRVQNSQVNHINFNDGLVGHNYDISSEVPSNIMAVVDIGSNSVRLIIYEKQASMLLSIFNEKALCGLAKNLDKTGFLSEETLQNTYKTLHRYFEIIKYWNIARDKIFCFATSAVREAKNGKDIVKFIVKNFACNIQVISGLDEAKLSAIGVINSTHKAVGITADLGGGSLEFAKINQGEVTDLVSFPYGILRINTGKDEGKIVKNFTEYQLEQKLKNQDLYLVGGSFRAIIKAHIHRIRYNIKILHNYSAPTAEIVKTLDYIEKIEEKKLVRLNIIPENRVAFIKNACFLLRQIISIGVPKNIICSSYGIREGIIYASDIAYEKLGAGKSSTDILIEAAKISLYKNAPYGYGKKWCYYAEKLFQFLKPILAKIMAEQQYRLAEVCCYFARLGWEKHNSYRGSYAFSYIMNSALSAITHQERALIAVAIFHRYETTPSRSLINHARLVLTGTNFENSRIIGFALRFAQVLSAGDGSLLQKFRLEVEARNKSLQIILPDDVSCNIITEEITKKGQKLAKAMKLKNFGYANQNWSLKQ